MGELLRGAFHRAGRIDQNSRTRNYLRFLNVRLESTAIGLSAPPYAKIVPERRRSGQLRIWSGPSRGVKSR